ILQPTTSCRTEFRRYDWPLLCEARLVILRRILIELTLALRRAEEILLPLVNGTTCGCLRIDGHAANWIFDCCHGALLIPEMTRNPCASKATITLRIQTPRTIDKS